MVVINITQAIKKRSMVFKLVLPMVVTLGQHVGEKPTVILSVHLD